MDEPVKWYKPIRKEWTITPRFKAGGKVNARQEDKWSCTVIDIVNNRVKINYGDFPSWMG
jgi:hypothetical protein